MPRRQVATIVQPPRFQKSTTVPSSVSTSPTLSYHTGSEKASSFNTFATSYDTSWFQDDSKPPSIISRASVIAAVPVTYQDLHEEEDEDEDEDENGHEHHHGDEHSGMETDSCQVDADDWFSRFHGEIDISDKPPKPEALAAAGDIPVFDSAGNSRSFKSLYSVGDVVGDRQLFVFIRHFYCGACQAYIRALTESIDMQTYFTMDVPTSIVVIGCGTPALIHQYKAKTQCPFPIFADPSRKLFKHLGMSLSLNIGYKRPEYFKDTVETAWLMEQFRQMGATPGKKKFRGGNWLQVGGEFLFQDGQVVWCHRMKNYRNHAEIPTLRRVLGIDE